MGFIFEPLRIRVHRRAFPSLPVSDNPLVLRYLTWKNRRRGRRETLVVRLIGWGVPLMFLACFFHLFLQDFVETHARIGARPGQVEFLLSMMNTTSHQAFDALRSWLPICLVAVGVSLLWLRPAAVYSGGEPNEELSLTRLSRDEIARGSLYPQLDLMWSVCLRFMFVVLAVVLLADALYMILSSLWSSYQKASESRADAWLGSYLVSWSGYVYARLHVQLVATFVEMVLVLALWVQARVVIAASPRASAVSFILLIVTCRGVMEIAARAIARILWFLEDLITEYAIFPVDFLTWSLVYGVTVVVLWRAAGFRMGDKFYRTLYPERLVDHWWVAAEWAGLRSREWRREVWRAWKEKVDRHRRAIYWSWGWSFGFLLVLAAARLLAIGLGLLPWPPYVPGLKRSALEALGPAACVLGPAAALAFQRRRDPVLLRSAARDRATLLPSALAVYICIMPYVSISLVVLVPDLLARMGDVQAFYNLIDWWMRVVAVSVVVNIAVVLFLVQRAGRRRSMRVLIGAGCMFFFLFAAWSGTWSDFVLGVAENADSPVFPFFRLVVLVLVFLVIPRYLRRRLVDRPSAIELPPATQNEKKAA